MRRLVIGLVVLAAVLAGLDFGARVWAGIWVGDRVQESLGLSKALRRYGFRFVGPTTAYAAMQSLGVVNDHLQGCHRRAACEAERRRLTVPGG